MTKAKSESYYAPLFGPNSKPLEARINGKQLETFEVHSYLPPYSQVTYFKGGQYVKKIIDPQVQPPKAWGTRFYIGYNGLIISTNYFDGSFSSEFAANWKKYSWSDHGKDSGSHAIVTTKEGRFSPDLLYAIPQITWNEFITLLPVQDIVKILDLSVHRHLWPAYNYSVSTEDANLQIRRAATFSQYHFLVAYLDPVKEEHCFYDENRKLKELIDQGHIADQAETKKFFGSYVTPNYLDKFSHYPTVEYFTYVGELIESRATSIYGIGAINTNRLNEFVDSLPSSKTDPVNFEKMISDANSIRDIRTGELAHTLNGRIFFHARNNFGLFKTKNLSNYSSCHYYFIGIFNDLIYPEILRVFFKISNLEYDKYDKNSNELRSLYSSSLATFKVILHEYLAIDELIELSSAWRSNRAAANSKKPAANIRLQWHPLFSPQTINQVSFICLETEAELRKEGEERRHCAGGWAPQCMKGFIHVIRVLTRSGEHSTMWLYEEKRNKFKIMYNLKFEHEEPCEEILIASELLLENINKDASILNFQRGKTEASAEQMDNISEYYPYRLDDSNSQESVYKAYPNDHLPSIMQADNYREMIAKLSERFDLVDCIRDALHDGKEEDAVEQMDVIKPI